VQAPSVASYEERLAELSGALSSALAPIVFECPGISEATVSGHVGVALVFEATATLNNGWSISDASFPLEIEVQALDHSVSTLNDLASVTLLKSRLESIPGATESFAGFLFDQTSSNVVARVLTDESVRDIRATVAENFAANLSETEARSSVAAILALIEQSAPQALSDFQRAVDAEIAGQIDAAWAALVDEFETRSFDSTDELSELISRLNALPNTGVDFAVIDQTISDTVVRQTETLVGQVEPGSPTAASSSLSAARGLLSLSVPSGFQRTQEALSTLSLQVALNAARFAAAEEFRTTESADRARALVNPLLVDLEDVAPARLEEVRNEVEQAIANEASGLWQAFLDDLYLRGDVFGDAVEQIADRSNALPIADENLVEIDTALANWIAEDVEVYDQLFQENYAENIAERMALATVLDDHEVSSNLTETQTTLNTLSSRLASEAESSLQDLVDDAIGLIELTGQSHFDVVDVLETGLAVSAELEEAGFVDQARLTLDATNSHIDRLLSEGLEALRAELLGSDMNRADIQLFQDEATVYSELSTEFPAFAEYAVAIDEGIASGRLRACQMQADSAVRSRDQLDQEVLGARGLTPISQFACDLYRNGHILVSYQPARLFRDASLVVDRADGVVETYQLDRDEENTGLRGVIVETDSGERAELDEADWLQRAAALTIPPPSGVPDVRGITECDQLAGDPQDPARVTEGIDLLQLPDDYDIERAIDACIAALEHDPSQIRFYHQLARVLDFVGAAEDADEPLQLALEGNYAPSQFIAAERAILSEDEDSFFDAIDLLRASAAGGYPPAETLLAELIPPGMDFFRPLPDPTDDQILDSLGRSECTPAIMGMQTCVTRTGIASKDCFQTGERTFSCEVRVRFSCRMQGGDALMSMMMGVACPPNSVSDPMFRDVRIVG
jgi:tetratricopeptide (TPR) repeat protein